MAKKVMVVFLGLFLGLCLYSCKKEQEEVPPLKKEKTSVSKDEKALISEEETLSAEIPSIQRKQSGPSKFIRTFMVKLRGGTPLVPGDEEYMAKFDMILITRNWYDAINGDTWGAIKAVDPTTEIYIQTEGPTIHKSNDNVDIRWSKCITRYSNSRGHSMGNIRDDNPEFFLLNKKGQWCQAYYPSYKERYSMDFGNPRYHKYWIEAVLTDVVKGPFGSGGIHIDNCGPVRTFPLGNPVKYDTPEKFAEAYNSFITAVTGAMHENNTKVWINAGGTASKRGWKGLLTLDELENPPDVVGEEGAFAHSWGKGRGTTFPGEHKWKCSLDFMTMLKKSRQAYFCHTKLARDETGIDNWDKPVTYWQSLWYAMCSYLLGKDDQLNNVYFYFFGDEGYGSINWWYDEYDHIDLGKTVSTYKMTPNNGTNIYWREFEKGYVYVNPTDRDVSSIQLPGVCKELDHYNFGDDPDTIPNVNVIDLKGHHGTILVKSSGDLTPPEKAQAMKKAKQASIEKAKQALIEKTPTRAKNIVEQWTFEGRSGKFIVGRLTKEKAYSGEWSLKAQKAPEGKFFDAEIRTDWNSVAKAVCTIPSENPYLNFAYYSTIPCDLQIRAELPGDVYPQKRLRLKAGEWVCMSLPIKDFAKGGAQALGKVMTSLVFRLSDASGVTFYIDDISISEGPVKPEDSGTKLEKERKVMHAPVRKPGERKFIQTFLYYLSGGREIVPGDENILAKFDMIMWNRWRYFQIDGNTWKAIKDINPDTEIYIYTQGVDTWTSWGPKDTFDPDLMDREMDDEKEFLYINNIARYNNPKGHSMGNLNTDNPDLFLLTKEGKRCQTYGSLNRFLLDFGNPKFHKYWLEAVKLDMLDQPWKADGIYLDNTGPLITFPTETPAKYDTPEKWAEADIRYVNAVTKGLHEKGQKVFINAGGTAAKNSIKIFKQLDNSPYPPDAVLEEGTFATVWGKADTNFMDEWKWKNSLDCLGAIANFKQAYCCHTNLNPGEAGTDNFGKKVTFRQTLWYTLSSFLIGKNDEQDNSYFSFGIKGSCSHKILPWFDEYEHIDLGKAVGKYKIVKINDSNIYWREFEEGYVYVNPTPNDVTGIKLPERCKQLNYDNFKDNYSTIPDIETIDLKSHHGTMLVKQNLAAN